MKTIKWFLIGIAGLIVLAFIAIGILLLAVDRGEYKQEIIDQVETHTGRQLSINGDLDISLFPWIGISIGELAMSNAKGFGDDAFVQVEAANIKVEVLPLLRRELRVDTIELVGVQLDLQRDAEGVNNWDDLTGSSEGEPESTSSSADTSTGAETENSPLAALAIGGVNISDARIRWRDRQQGTDATLRDFDLSIGEIKLHEVFPLSLSFIFEDATSALLAELSISSNVSIDIQQQKYILNSVAFEAKLKGKDLPENGVKVALAADAVADLGAQTATVEKLSGSVAGIAFNGALEGEQIVSAPAFSGTLNIESFNLKSVLKEFAIALPETAKEDALTAVDASLTFAANEAEVQLAIGTAHLDSTAISGEASVKLGTVPDINFALAIDQINVDDYLPPTAEAEATTTTSESTGESTTSGTAIDPDDQPIGLPLEALAAQNVAGKLTIGQLTAANLKVSDVVVPISIRDSVAKLENASAKLYNGSLDASATLNAAGPQTHPPTMSTKANLFGVQVGPLLNDLQDGEGSLSGTGDIRLDLSTRGETPRALKSDLNGTVALNFRDGAVKGINIAQSLRKAKAKLKGQDFAEDEPVTTDFAQMSVSGNIKNGVMNSEDLDMRSPLLRVSGAGDVDLNRDYVDYKARVLITDDKTGQGGKRIRRTGRIENFVANSWPISMI